MKGLALGILVIKKMMWKYFNSNHRCLNTKRPVGSVIELNIKGTATYKTHKNWISTVLACSLKLGPHISHAFDERCAVVMHTHQFTLELRADCTS